jgi:hypothetical protein
MKSTMLTGLGGLIAAFVLGIVVFAIWSRHSMQSSAFGVASAIPTGCWRDPLKPSEMEYDFGLTKGKADEQKPTTAKHRLLGYSSKSKPVDRSRMWLGTKGYPSTRSTPGSRSTGAWT